MKAGAGLVPPKTASGAPRSSIGGPAGAVASAAAAALTAVTSAAAAKQNARRTKVSNAAAVKQEHEDQQDASSSGAAQKVSTADIQLVQNLIERCLQLYMPQKEVAATLHAQVCFQWVD